MPSSAHILPGIQGVVYGLAIIVIILLAPEGVYWKVRDKLGSRRAALRIDAVAGPPANVVPMTSVADAPSVAAGIDRVQYPAGQSCISIMSRARSAACVPWTT